jgi:hypothetical protein
MEKILIHTEPTIIIVGCNSLIYSSVRDFLSEYCCILELNSFSALQFDFKKYDFSNVSVVIFSGKVTNDLNVLQDLENYHKELSQKLSVCKSLRVCLISSSAVYGDWNSQFTEGDPCRPTTNYGKSKLSTERYYQFYLNHQTVLLRLGNVIGFDSLTSNKPGSASNICLLDCRADYSTALRTYVDRSCLIQMLLLPRYILLPRAVNIGRCIPQTMVEIAQNLGINFQLRVAEDRVRDITLNTNLFHTLSTRLSK